MKKTPLIALAAGLLTVLAGCIIVDTSFRITTASAFTNFQSSSGESFVCDNKQTIVSYTFKYSDASLFTGWDSFLKGYASGEIKGLVSFDASDSRNNPSTRTVAVDYLVQPGAIPLSLDKVNPQAIIIVPTPSVIGRTYVVVRAKATTGNKEFAIGPIRVIDNCP